MKLLDGVKATAMLSDDGVYRYLLTREWEATGRSLGRVLWIMLNPSTADANEDDATIRKCQKFARSWGYDGITVVNLFALRATNPKELRTHPNPVGQPYNDYFIEGWMREPVTVVAAWGSNPIIKGTLRDLDMLQLAQASGKTLYNLRTSMNGNPWHPLYVPDETKLSVFRAHG